MTVRVERATADDWRRLSEVRRRGLQTDPRAFSAGAHARPDDEQHWRDRIAQRGPSFLAVDEHGHDVGLVGLDVGDRLELVSMWVAPQARGRGVGAALVAAVVSACAGAELGLRVMADNAEAIGFYAGQGFVLVSEEPDDEGTLTMRRAASPGPTVWPSPAARPRRPGASPRGPSADQ